MVTHLPILAVVIPADNAAPGRLRHAARLLGAAATLWVAIGTPLLPSERADYDQAVAALRAALGGDVYAAAWDEGAARTPEQALAGTLGEPATG